MYTNIAAYKFTSLRPDDSIDLQELRQRLFAVCQEGQLKGTILLSPEGINLFVAGMAPAVDRLVKVLTSLPALADLPLKYSESDNQPFTRMLVKIKKEIIAFGVDGIDPARHPSAKISAAELKRWLDDGRPLTLLDTRNDYEIKLGTFKNAIPIGIRHFRDFPQAVRNLPDAWKQQPIVMFCTGGIRCEKAGPYMEQQGFEQVFQLDGGILKYFEECGTAHYDGKCFVFDQRVGVDADLSESSDQICFACLTPLTTEEQSDPRYLPGVHCPFCFRTPAERMALKIERREQAIRQATDPLPGAAPYDNYRPVRVPSRHDGQTLCDLLSGLFAHVSTAEWRTVLDRGLIVNSSLKPVQADHRVRAGEQYFRLEPACREPAVAVNIRCLYEDDAIVVVNKPAPLPMHACGRFNRNTLQSILFQVYQPECLRFVHRLDANTSGVVLIARNRHFSRLLQSQFATGAVEKVYFAQVVGRPSQDEFFCNVPISSAAREIGARNVDLESGLSAHTDFRVMRRNDDGTTLLEVRPRTGRTNQIRVHLWHLGLPICGDPTYLADCQTGEVQTLDIQSPPLRLFAATLGFLHPVSRDPLCITGELPDWAQISG